MKEATITVLPEDFLNSTDYFDNRNCPMAMAFKRTYPDELVNVSGNYIRTKSGELLFDKDHEGVFSDSWTAALVKHGAPGDGPGDACERIKYLLQNGGTIEPITIHMAAREFELIRRS